MGEIKQRLIECALREWHYFGGSTRDEDDRWSVAGTGAVEPFRSRVNQYWRAVGEPDWDGATNEPWSAAFISWCFRMAGAEGHFAPDGTHSIYIDRIRRGDGMSELLTLRSPAEAAIAPGDLIWNSRQPDLANPVADIPLSYESAVERLEGGDFFPSHVDIVIAVDGERCDSIGGNVSPPGVSGSVTRSTWRLDAEGRLADPRKSWIGVVTNRL